MTSVVMETSVNGAPFDWSREIQARWAAVTQGWPAGAINQVTFANYFTPRPYRNEYDKGSREEGFVYTIGGNVCRCIIRVADHIR